MRKKPRAMLLYVSDWRDGTWSIPAKYRGPYLDVCLALFDNDGSIKNEPQVIANAARLTPRQFPKFWESVAPKFLVSQDEIRHQKVDDVLVEYYQKSAKLQQNGSKGGRKYQQKQRSVEAIAKANQPKGLGSPLQGKTQPALDDNPKEPQNLGSTSADSSPPCEDGRSLSAVGRELINDIWTACGTAMSLRNRDALEASIVSAEDRTLTVKQDWWEAPGNQYFVDKADGAGVVIQPAGAEVVNFSERKATA